MIGSKIVEMRKKLSWSQARLAKEINVSVKSIKNWEAEVSEPSLQNIVQLAKVFSVTTDYLLGLESACAIRIDGLSPKDQKCLRAICQIYISNALDVN
mgnify:CR=1 FL=1